ncbi:hypothetical protein KP509_03G078700 [Ceratopteris richardii]|uniref:Protein kinase domain-containing protein n=1 Tax=Ceratopteris richardii TaxID=49495 RepID=A0A8T2V4B6_CERRI|nr:hypothetical protein KP509_03G078700 [Ceratopteris richardii]
MGQDEELLPCTRSSQPVIAPASPISLVDDSAVLRKFLIPSDDVQVVEQIGEGSSGVVYRGTFKDVEKVAIKELKGALVKGSKMQGQLRREALSLISCAHRNVLKFYGIWLNPSYTICIVTKFMEGGSLFNYLAKKKSLPTKVIIKLARDIARGMQFLHSRGVLHMDLKSANVFLDEEGNAVIGDLGIARLVNEKDGECPEIGTYRWMAPEVLNGTDGESPEIGTYRCLAPEVWARSKSDSKGNAWPFSYKSDVYSFGILLWELVTCKLPYADYSPVQAAVGVMMHGLRPPIPASTFPPLRFLIQKCWDQKPSNRPHFFQILEMLDIISLHAQKCNQ